MVLEVEAEVTNQDPLGTEVAPVATNPEPVVDPEVTPKLEEPTPEPATPAEAMHTLKVDGKEESLPLSKVLDYAQQGRHYAQKVGQYNQDVESKANELANASVEKWLADNQTKPAPVPAVDPTNPNQEIEEEDEFTKVARKVDELTAIQTKEKFEREVTTIQKDLSKRLAEAKDKFELMNDDSIFATLRFRPDADIMALAEASHKKELEVRATWQKNYLDEAEKRAKRGAEGAGGTVTAPKAGKVVLGENTLDAATEFLANQN